MRESISISEAVENLRASGKVSALEALRILALPSQQLQVAAVSAVTERELREDLKTLRYDLQTLKIYIARHKIARAVRTETTNIFREMLRHM